jgi:hypothetical protein
MAKKKLTDQTRKPGKDGQRGHCDVRKGPISQDELEFMLVHKDLLDIPEIMKRLNRSEPFVKKHMASLPEVQRRLDKNDWVSRLHASSFWTEIRKGLIGNEVPYFERAWASYMEQFGSNSEIMATDELMIKDLVMLDIFVQRSINEKAEILREIKRIEDLLEEEYSLVKEQQDQEKIANSHSQLLSLFSAKNSISKEHIEYQKSKDGKLKDLKGSREQRFKQLEESKKNIFELIKELDTMDRRREDGRMAEKVKIAADKVKEDWNNSIQFDDDVYDKPFLYPEGEVEEDE